MLLCWHDRSHAVFFLLRCVDADALCRVVSCHVVASRCGSICLLCVVLCCCDWCVMLRCVFLCSVVRDVVYCERRAALWSVVLCCAVFSPS